MHRSYSGMAAFRPSFWRQTWLALRPDKSGFLREFPASG